MELINQKNGFTLTELLIVISIIMVMVVISFSGFRSIVNRAEDASIINAIIGIQSESIGLQMKGETLLGFENNLVVADAATTVNRILDVNLLDTFFHDGQRNFCTYVTLQDERTWCIDATGFSGEVSSIDIYCTGTVGVLAGTYRCVPKILIGGTYQLTVTRPGTGTGTVVSTTPVATPLLINCGIDCDETVNQGTEITLRATPDAGSTFTGWTDALCAPSGTADCTVTMDAAKTVTANFDLALPGWDFQRQITIDNTLNTNVLTNFQILVTLATVTEIAAGQMRSDCGDVRFTDTDGTTIIPHWLESGCDTTTTQFWVNVPTIPANSTANIFIYYGNATATSTSDGVSTFVFFDDFEDGDYTDWPIYERSGGCSYATAITTGKIPNNAVRLQACIRSSGWVTYSRKSSIHIPPGNYTLTALAFSPGIDDVYDHRGEIELGATITQWLEKGAGWVKKEAPVSLISPDRVIIRTETSDTHNCALCDCCGAFLVEHVYLRRKTSPTPTLSVGPEL